MSKTEKVWLSIMMSIVLAIALVSATEELEAVFLVAFLYAVTVANFIFSD